MESTGIGRRTLLTGTAAATALAATTLLPARAYSEAVAAPKPAQADSERIARQLLQVDEHGADLKLQALRILIDNGLPKTNCPKKIIIVGAGITGLTAAMLLKYSGHEVTILEANGNRTGGRIKTFHGNKHWLDGRLHAEAGAMRIPSHHPLVLALVDKLGIPRRRFHLADVPRDYATPTDTPPVVYHASTGETWTNKPQAPSGRPATGPAPDTGNTLIEANGITTTRKQYLAAPVPLNASFGHPGTDNVGTLIAKALQPLLPAPGQTPAQRLAHWTKLIAGTDDYSLQRYLEEAVGWDTNTIRLVGTLANMTSRLPLSLLHTLTDYLDIDTTNTYWELTEGTDALTNHLTDKMRPALRMNQRVIRIVQTDHNVQVHAVPETGDEDTDGFPQAITTIHTADNVIVTAPFPALQFIDFEPALSYNKRRAITELHYDSATKVLLEFNHRFWEDGPHGWRGGGSITDGPNRFIYYPSHSPQRSRGGIILASYTWADDARRWDPLTPGERRYFALAGLAALHGRDVYKHHTGFYATQSWSNARWALGEAAVFTPGQAHDLHLATYANEGRIHFAGEHTSLKHAWIEGSLESAVRAAQEVN